MPLFVYPPSRLNTTPCPSVSVPPGRPLLHNERGILVEDVLGPYNEGAELMLTCSVSGGESLCLSVGQSVSVSVHAVKGARKEGRKERTLFITFISKRRHLLYAL